MKKTNYKIRAVLICTLAHLLISTSIFAQAPQKMSYQAVIRNSSNALITSTTIGMKISILQGSATGTPIYIETQTPTTNANGLATMEIGSGAIVSGTFATINWANGPYFIKIQTDPSGGTAYTISGTSEFISVPYALFSANGTPGPQGSIGLTGANGISISWLGTLAANPATATLNQAYYNSTDKKSYVNDGSTWQLMTQDGATGTFQNGSTPGEMLYWNGSNWTSIAPGTTGQVLTINSSNIPVWQTASGISLLAPVATTQAATNIQSFATTLNGTVNANNLSTTVEFQWGLTTAYGSSNYIASQSPVTGIADVAVSLNLGGLQSATTYHYRIKATNAVNITYSSDMSFTTLTSAPQLTTAAISSILAFSASTGGNITYDGGSAVTTRGICYSTSPVPTTANNIIPSGTGTGSFVSNITGLTFATTYYVRAYATNAIGTSYGNEISFTTQNGVITLSTTNISAITGTSASTGGNITADGGSSVTVRGVCWNTNPSPTLANSFTSNGTGNGAFTSNLTGLAIGTTYYVRAYATNNVGTTYGNELSFTTVALPTVTTANVSDVRGTSAKAGGNITNNGGSDVTTQGLCWSTSANPTTANSITTSFTAVMSGLSPNTVYYVKAYATNIAGTGYGNEISFNSGYTIGSTYGGGLVFYNDGNARGLVCAPTDQSTGAIWGCDGVVVAGTSSAINTGDANTNTIVAACTTVGIAAELCYNLVLNTYSDWYLPSLDELNLMYVNLRTQSMGGFANTPYWSSFQYPDMPYPYAQDFTDGSQNFYNGQNFYVRAARSF